MNFGSMKATVRSILRRNDVTDAQLGEWINSCVPRNSRRIKIPTAEKTATTTPVDVTTELVTPNDYQEMISVTVDGVPLTRIAINTMETYRSESNPSSVAPLHWARKANKFLFWPAISAGAVVELYYYGDAATFSNDYEETTLSVIDPYLFIWGALGLAGHWANDDRREEWEGKFEQRLDELQTAAIAEEFSGGEMQVRPTYTVED